MATLNPLGLALIEVPAQILVVGDAVLPRAGGGLGELAHLERTVVSRSSELLLSASRDSSNDLWAFSLVMTGRMIPMASSRPRQRNIADAVNRVPLAFSVGGASAGRRAAGEGAVNDQQEQGAADSDKPSPDIEELIQIADV